MLSQVGVSECMLKNQQWANQKVPEGTITPYDVTKLLRIRNVNSPPLPHHPTLHLSPDHTQHTQNSQPYSTTLLSSPQTNKRYNFLIGYEPKRI